MRRSLLWSMGAAVTAASLSLDGLRAQQQPGIPGEVVPGSAISPLILEPMDVVLAREKSAVYSPTIHGVWNGQDGRWIVPAETAKTPSHSGTVAIINEWGDPRMGIGFGRLVDLGEVWVAAQGSSAPPTVRFAAYRAGILVERTEWIGLSATPRQVALRFAGVDRLEVQTSGPSGGPGFIALDDLLFSVHGQPQATTLLDFEDLSFRTTLTASRYAGLDWESGRGFRLPIPDASSIHAPLVLAPGGVAGSPEDDEPLVTESASGPTAPVSWVDFVGAIRGDPGAGFIPPDSCGAVGPDHYVSTVNTNLSAFTKNNGARVLNVSLNSFWGSTGTTGDPRAVFDPASQRFILLATNFSSAATIFLAISQTSDPTGAWFKFQFQTNQGTDASRWPDYPTLGVDARGIYCAAYMVGSPARMTIWAIDKAPLLTGTPAVGTITAFRSLPWEGAIQPCTTYGDPGGEYLVSLASSTSMRLRRVNPPMTAPTLSQIALVAIPTASAAPNAPALGSATNINTLDTRPMNAVFRNGSVWTIHGVSSAGRAACRWYEFSVSPVARVQVGTITDPLWHYYFGSIAVDADGSVGFGLSGSHAGAYPSVFVAGRLATDPINTVSPPVLVKAGDGPINDLDGSNRNRFGDYSHINVDPVDDRGFWTIQEYADANARWQTRIARFGYERVLYGDGLAGASGIPSIGTTTRPVIGQPLVITMGNSSGVNGAGTVLVFGLAQAAIPVLGGTLNTTPVITQGLALSAAGGTYALLYPNDPNLVGQPVFFQTVQIDAAAAQGFAFSCGMQIRPDSR